MIKGGVGIKKAETQEEENFANAKRVLSRLIGDSLGDFAEKSHKIDFIKSIRDKLLAHQYISVELDKDDDAYLVFETLNTRGKDLRISDLVKNHFARHVKGRAKTDDPVQEKWGGIVRKFDSVKTAYTPDDFLLHYWLAKEAYVSKAKLFREFKDATPKASAQARLDEIVKYAEVYIEIVAPSDAEWSKAEIDIKNSLRALSIFRVAQALPLVLAIMRLYRAGIIKIPQTANALRLIESFTFQFNAVTQSRGGGGISAMYAKLAQSIVNIKDPNSFAAQIKEVKKKFAERLPTPAEFDAQLALLTYRANYTRDRDLVRYVLTEISFMQGMGPQFATEAMTIEHIQSQ